MSKTIDQRVVEMQFDNKQFESNVQTSLSTLDKLKQSLNLEGAAKGLDNIGSAAKNVNMSGLGGAVDTVKAKFSALEVIAVTALANITNSVVNTGKQMLKSLTVEPISQGFSEYELKMGSIQTIMASTGESLETVNGYLEELNKYSDKTIYSFADMTSNIGKFTNAGVKLEDAVKAIQGVSNEAAVSGANANEASRAMYNFAQALSAGYVKLIDWKSIENANMATVEFKQQLIDTAVEMGTLEKTADGMYKVLTTNANGASMKEAIDSTRNFNDSLSYQWMTSEVLIKTLGRYADETTEIGKKAFAAAQDVKTFTQLMDTLKEAAGSGWAETWEILFGNFEEAKKLWTSISEVIGGYIDQQSDARNEMLKGWKDLGGRSELIDALTNAFNGLVSVIKPIKEAFREIFPATTAQQLYDITEKFKNFTEKLKLSETQSANLKSTFKGLFAVLDIVKQGLSAIWNVISPLIGGITGLGDGVLGVTASWGEWLVSLDETIKKTNIFNGILQGLVGFVKTGFGTVKELVSNATKSIKSFIETLKEKFNFSGFELFHSLLERVQTRMNDVGETVGNMKSGVVTAFEVMGEAIANSKFLQVLTAIWEGIKKIGSGIASALGRMISGLTEKLGNADFSGVLDTINSLSLAGIGVMIGKFVKGLSEPLEGLQGILDGITGILDGVRGCLEAYQTKLKADALIKIAGAIAILAAAIVVISLIDSAKLASSLAAIGALFAELMTAMAIFTKISGSSVKVTKACATMLVMSVSITVLASALKKLGELNWDQLEVGLISIGGLMAELVVSVNLLSKNSGKMISGATGLVIFAAAIKILASACEDLSELSWGGLSKGLVGVGVLLAGVDVFLNTSKFSGKVITTATGIVILASAIKILASACEDFGDMSWNEIGKGLASIAGLLVEITVFTKLTGNAKNVMSTAAGLVLIAASMKIFASAVSDFGEMSWEEIGKGLTAMGIALTEVAIAINVMPKNLISTGTGLAIVATSLVILSSALSNMGNMSWGEITKGLVAMGISLAELAIGLKAMTGTLSGSAALLVASAALAVLAPTLSLLGAMSLGSIIKSLVTLAGTFAVLGVAAAVLTPLAPVIITLAGALALIGVSVLGVGAGLTLAGTGLSALAVGFTALAAAGAAGATSIVAALTVIITGVAGLIPAVVTKIGEGVVAFCEAIAAGSQAICESVVAILDAVVSALVEVIPTVVDGIFVLLDSILSALVEYTPTIVQAVFDILIACLEGISNNISQVVQTAIDVVLGFIDGVSQKIPDVIQAGFDLLLSFINGMTDAINNNTETLVEAIKNLVLAILDAGVAVLTGGIDLFKEIGERIMNIGFLKGIKDKASDVYDKLKEIVKESVATLKEKIKDFKNIAKDMIDGFIQGIKDKISSAVDAIKEFGSNIVDGIKGFLGIHSPSTVFADIGNNSIQGFVDGMGEFASKVVGKASEIVSGVKTAISNGVSRFKMAGQDMISNIADGLGNGLSFIKEKASNIASAAKIAISEKASDFKSAGQTLIDNVVTGFGDKIESVKSKANSIASSAKTAIGDQVSTFKSTGQTLISNVVTGFNDKLSSAKSKASNIATTAKTAISTQASNFKTAGKTLISNVVTGFNDKLSSARSKATSIATSAKTAISNQASKFKSAGQTLISNVVMGFNDKLSSAKIKASSIASAAKEAISNWRNSFTSVGQNLISGLIEGIGDKAQSLVNKARGVVSDAIQAAKNLLGINSPSKVFAEMGRYVDEGFIVGLEKFAGKVANATGNIGQGAVDAMSNVISGISDAINCDIDSEPTIRPVIDLTNIQNGVNKLNGLFGQQTVSLAGVNAGILSGDMNTLASIAAQMSKYNGSGNSEVVNAITSLRGDVASLAESIAKMKVVMDSGTMVGELIGKIDNGLGQIAVHKGRGN